MLHWYYLLSLPPAQLPCQEHPLLLHSQIAHLDQQLGHSLAVHLGDGVPHCRLHSHTLLGQGECLFYEEGVVGWS
ncbi:hypothetical protein ACHAXS_006684 [Conticribra weissflogii]